MSSVLLYHGSEQIVAKPAYGKGKANNDYGRGFYCTENIELAKEWACANGNDGYANRYSLDVSDLRILNLNGPEYTVLNWLAILARHRTYWQNGSIAEEGKRYLQEHFYVDTDPYDVIVGYRANDSYFTFAQDFVAGTISLARLSAAMKLGKLGEQVVLKSRKVFAQIRFEGADPAKASEYYVKKVLRDREARREYRMTKSAPRQSLDEIYILDIMREGMKSDDARLR